MRLMSIRQSCFGDITVFASDSSTGRLSLVVNEQIKDPVTGLQLTYFPVGQLPKMMALSGSCLFTLNSDGNQTVFPVLHWLKRAVDPDDELGH